MGPGHLCAVNKAHSRAVHTSTRCPVALGQRQGDQASQRGNILQKMCSLCSLGISKTPRWGDKGSFVKLTTHQALQASRWLHSLYVITPEEGKDE